MDENPDTLSPEDEAALLATTAPRVLFRALSSVPEVADKLFAGFRRSADNLKLPHVRARLHHESESNPEVHQLLREAWSESRRDLVSFITQWKPAEIPPELPALIARWGRDAVRLALRLDPREEVRDIPLPAAEPQPEPQVKKPARERKAPSPAPDVGTLREEIRSLKEELREAGKREARLRADADQARRSAERWETAARAALGEVNEHRRAAERAVRQLEREQRARGEWEARARESMRDQRQTASELDALRRQMEDARQARAARDALFPPGEAWLETARALARTGQAQAVVNVLSPLLAKHPDSDPVREALAEAHEALGTSAMAVAGFCTLARKRLRQGDLGEAALFACRALACSPDDREAGRCAEEVKRAAAGSSEELPRPALRRLDAFAKRSPLARGLVEALAACAAGSGAKRLTLDTPVEWPEGKRGFTVPLRWVLEAVDGNRIDAVERVRKALTLLRTHQPAAYAAVTKALGEHDGSYQSVLAGKTRPIVVDGSNVAWQGTEGGERPRLANVLGVRRELRALGYFPIRIHVDAALVYQIDRRPELEALIGRGEILVADPGTDADEQILEDARKLGCAVVTNDRMADHDPEDQVAKVRFDIEPGGPVVHARKARR